jgi:hypothetical protein
MNISLNDVKRKLEAKDNSFHILLTTIGKGSIQKMLESLLLQLKKEDFLTVVYDGKDIEKTLENVKIFVKKFVCKTNVIFNQENLGFWGHGLRNKYNDLPGDFIMHGDDDDYYLPNALQDIRNNCLNKDTLYFFPFLKIKKKIFSNPFILGAIGTPSGIVPSKINKCGNWKYIRGGDYHFYKSIEKLAKNIQYIDIPIYYAN